ncbi:MAG: response regulator transcription factor [Steroidobacteraceae bacterium]
MEAFARERTARKSDVAKSGDGTLRSVGVRRYRVASILVIEDDEETAAQIQLELRRHGHRVELEVDGVTALDRACRQQFDLITVDRLLPRLDGLALIDRLRRKQISTPVLVLSALSDVEERVRGLRSGGDDYLTKPFAFIELCARVDNLLRRATQPRTTLLCVGDLELDLIDRTARRGPRLLNLTPREFSLLEYLMRHADTVVTRSMMFKHLWDYDFDPGTKVINVHISRLRRQLEQDNEEPMIETRRGVGFVLRARE